MANVQLLFLSHEADELGIKAIQALSEEAKFNIKILQNGQSFSDVSVDNKSKLGVAFFADPGEVRKHALRAASHRVEKVPAWAEGCSFSVALKKDNPKAVQSVARQLSMWEGMASLTEIAPWGQIPTGADNFELFREWVRRAFGVDPDELNIIYQPPKLSPAVLRKMRQLLNSFCFSPTLVSDIIRSVQNVGTELDIGYVAKTVKFFKEMVSGNKNFNIQLGAQTERFLTSVWKGYLGKPVELVIPVCPAWSHDEQGYTFKTVDENSTGVAYQMMIERLEQFIPFFQKLDIRVNITILVGDIEWFDVRKGDYKTLQEDITEYEFMRRISVQTGLIRADLQRRGLQQSEVQAFLEVFPRDEFLDRCAEERSKFEAMLKTSEWVQGTFDYIMEFEAPLYTKQCGIRVDPKNPHPQVKDAALDDIRLYLTFVGLIQEMYGEQNLCFFTQSDPFMGFYRSVPHVGWKVPRKGAF